MKNGPPPIQIRLSRPLSRSTLRADSWSHLPSAASIGGPAPGNVIGGGAFFSSFSSRHHDLLHSLFVGLSLCFFVVGVVALVAALANPAVHTFRDGVVVGARGGHGAKLHRDSGTTSASGTGVPQTTAVDDATTRTGGAGGDAAPADGAAAQGATAADGASGGNGSGGRPSSVDREAALDHLLATPARFGLYEAHVRVPATAEAAGAADAVGAGGGADAVVGGGGEQEEEGKREGEHAQGEQEDGQRRLMQQQQQEEQQQEQRVLRLWLKLSWEAPATAAADAPPTQQRRRQRGAVLRGFVDDPEQRRAGGGLPAADTALLSSLVIGGQAPSSSTAAGGGGGGGGGGPQFPVSLLPWEPPVGVAWAGGSGSSRSVEAGGGGGSSSSGEAGGGSLHASSSPPPLPPPPRWLHAAGLPTLQSELWLLLPPPSPRGGGGEQSEGAAELPATVLATLPLPGSGVGPREQQQRQTEGGGGGVSQQRHQHRHRPLGGGGGVADVSSRFWFVVRPYVGLKGSMFAALLRHHMAYHLELGFSSWLAYCTDDMVVAMSQQPSALRAALAGQLQLLAWSSVGSPSPSSSSSSHPLTLDPAELVLLHNHALLALSAGGGQNQPQAQELLQQQHNYVAFADLHHYLASPSPVEGVRAALAGCGSTPLKRLASADMRRYLYRCASCGGGNAGGADEASIWLLGDSGGGGSQFVGGGSQSVGETEHEGGGGSTSSSSSSLSYGKHPLELYSERRARPAGGSATRAIVSADKTYSWQLQARPLLLPGVSPKEEVDVADSCLFWVEVPGQLNSLQQFNAAGEQQQQQQFQVAGQQHKAAKHSRRQRLAGNGGQAGGREDASWHWVLDLLHGDSGQRRGDDPPVLTA